MKAAVITLIVNLAASLILMFPLKHLGLALANSLAAAVNIIILGIVLRKKIGSFLDRNFYLSTLKIITSSLVMWGAIMLIGFFLPWDSGSSFRSRLIYLLTTITLGAATFFTCSYLLKSPEMQSIIRLLKKRFSR